MTVKVVLLENYPQLGYVGDIVKVKPGYARNWLVPKGLAAPVRDREARVVAHLMNGVRAKKTRLRAEAQGLADTIAAVTLEFTLQLGSQGKVFGAVTSRDIEAALKGRNIKLDRRQIRLAEPLRTFGEHSVEIKLHPEVKGAVRVIVKNEFEEKAKELAAQKAKEAAEGGATEETEPKKKRGSKYS